MYGRLFQYRGIHDFVTALSMPNALINSTGEQPFERFNAAPTAQLTLFHLEDQFQHVDMVRWGWGPHWSKALDRTPMMKQYRLEKCVGHFT